MKKNIITVKVALPRIFAISFAPLCNAQDNEINTIFSSGIEHHGGYGAFEMKLCPGSDYAIWTGIRGGWIVNRTFSIGGAAYGLLPTKTSSNIIDGVERQSRHTGGYGGLFFEYINSSNKMIHFTGNLMLGFGALTSHEYYGNTLIEYDDDRYPVAIFAVIEPGVTVDVNVSKYFRMGIGVSYKVAPYFDAMYWHDPKSITTEILDKKELSGLAINIAFKFGKF
jgi:hypothetical protein